MYPGFICQLPAENKFSPRLLLKSSCPVFPLPSHSQLLASRVLSVPSREQWPKDNSADLAWPPTHRYPRGHVQQSPVWGRAGHMLRRHSAWSLVHQAHLSTPGQGELSRLVPWCDFWPGTDRRARTMKPPPPQGTPPTSEARPHAEIVIVYPQKLLRLCQRGFGDVRAALRDRAAGREGQVHHSRPAR